MPEYKDVRRGQKLEAPASRYNAVNDLLRRQADENFNRGVIDAPTRITRPPDVRVKNVSGELIDRFAVVEVTGTALAIETHDFQTSPVLEVEKPATDAVVIAVLSTPTADDRIGDAWITGLVTLKIDVNDESHTYVRPQDNVAKFETADTGWAIAWKESGTGEKWAVVNLSQQSAGGEAGSSIVLAQAQAGGIPKRFGASLGQGTARVITDVANSTTGGIELTSVVIDVLNPSKRIAGEKGDRIIWLSDNKNGAHVIGWDDPNDGDPSDIPQQQPQTN